MREDIRMQLEQVQHAMTPEGYQKKNRRGLFPSDWDVRPLKVMSSPVSEKAGERDFETLSISAGIGFVNQAEKFGRELSGEQYVNYTVLKRGDFSYNKGNSKTYPQGCIYRLDIRDIAAVPNVFNSFRLLDDICNSDYYAQLFIYGYMNRQLYRLINAGVRNDGLLNLYDKDFYSCKLPVPPLHEQHKIAEILNQCDKVIELKQRLIEAECNRKKWLIQNLLDPASGVRLPGFDGEWIRFTLGANGKTYGGLTGKAAEDFGSGKPYIPYLNIFQNHIIDDSMFDHVAVASTERQNRVQYGDVFFTTSSETPTEVGMSAVYLGSDEELYLNSFSFGYRLKNFDKLVPEFAAYYFNSVYFKRILYRLAQGATRYNLSKTDLMKQSIMLPPTILEQAMIAELMAQIDYKIELLEQELTQWQQRKKALMQLLLTGIVRVSV